MKTVSVIAVLLTVIGALNWGLVGVGDLMGSNLNLVDLVLGTWPTVETIVYLLVGLSGILVGWAHLAKECTMCKNS